MVQPAPDLRLHLWISSHLRATLLLIDSLNQAETSKVTTIEDTRRETRSRQEDGQPEPVESSASTPRPEAEDDSMGMDAAPESDGDTAHDTEDLPVEATYDDDDGDDDDQEAEALARVKKFNVWEFHGVMFLICQEMRAHGHLLGALSDSATKKKGKKKKK